jgi:hypothetical protein
LYWSDSGQFGQNLVRQNLTTVVGRRRISAQLARFLPNCPESSIVLPDSGRTGQILDSLAGIWSAGIRRRLPGITGFWHKLLYSGTGGIPATIAGIQPMPPDSDNRIPKFGDLRQYIWATNKLQCTAFTDSHKHACKNEEFKSRKRFTVFKTVNRFPKIKEAFMVKLKIISLYHHFWLY